MVLQGLGMGSRPFFLDSQGGVGGGYRDISGWTALPIIV